MTNASNPSPIVISAVMERNEHGELYATLPESVLDNALRSGRPVSIRPVEQLPYRVDQVAFQAFCTERDLSAEERKTVEDLIAFNSGRVTWGKLRCFLSRSASFCKQLADDLIAEQFATSRPSTEVEMYFLPVEKYGQGWLGQNMYSEDEEFVRELMDLQ